MTTTRSMPLSVTAVLHGSGGGNDETRSRTRTPVAPRCALPAERSTARAGSDPSTTAPARASRKKLRRDTQPLAADPDRGAQERNR